MYYLDVEWVQQFSAAIVNVCILNTLISEDPQFLIHLFYSTNTEECSAGEPHNLVTF